MWQDLLDFAETHSAWIRAAALFSVVVFVGSLVLLPMMIARLPVDYFATEDAPPTSLARRHPNARLALLVLRSTLGVLLLLAGIAMLVLPGQGVLTILAAICLMSFPGKRRLELALVRRPRVLRGLNWIRRRAKHPPLHAPPPS